MQDVSELPSGCTTHELRVFDVSIYPRVEGADEEELVNRAVS